MKYEVNELEVEKNAMRVREACKYQYRRDENMII